MVGHYWLRAPELAPTPEIGAAISGARAAIKSFAAQVHEGRIPPSSTPRFTQVLSIGIGGSALGPMFVSDALGDQGPGRMHMHFIDNTDPDGIARALSRLEGRLDETLCIVTSKGGGTAETRNGQIVVANAYDGAGLHFPAFAVAITMPGSSLDRQAESECWLDARAVSHVRLGGRQNQRTVRSGTSAGGLARPGHRWHVSRRRCL